jgi:hypothetical protein
MDIKILYRGYIKYIYLIMDTQFVDVATALVWRVLSRSWCGLGSLVFCSL